jgi:hypothetical protein
MSKEDFTDSSRCGRCRRHAALGGSRPRNDASAQWRHVHPLRHDQEQADIPALVAPSRGSACRRCPASSADYPAPIVRNADNGRELTMARWGMPSSQKALMDATAKRAAKLEAKGKQFDFKGLLQMETDGGTPNIRSTSSKQPESRG